MIEVYVRVVYWDSSMWLRADEGIDALSFKTL